MRRSCLSSAEHAPLRIEPQRGQIPENDVKSAAGEGGHVLHEDDTWSHFANDSGVLKPKTGSSTFFKSGSFACDADVLTRESSSDAIHDAAPRSAVEGDNIRPDRSVIQSAVLHTRRQYCGGIGFPLHETHRASASVISASPFCAVSRAGEVDPEIETSGTGEERKHVEGRWSHTYATGGS